MASASGAIEQRNQDATVYVGNLDEKVTEELLWELMLQAGVVVNVHIPRDKVTSKHGGYGFVEFRTEEDAEYATKVMNMIQLFNKIIRVKKSSQDCKTLDIGANLFLGNLDPDVDEKLLYDTFSAFGGIVETPKIMRDPDTKVSRGFGFVSYDSFEAADLAIECMNAQYLCNRQIVVQYAYKKGSNNERHGSQAERLLASSNPNKMKPHTRFAFSTPAVPQPPPMAMGLQPMMMAPVGMMPPPPVGMMAPQYMPPPPPQQY
ncbi:DNA independent RNA polymerase I transcription factor [Aphanomyces cochlioides]|nr:DNA independent RNA polymerase I transcription factor [Aphanomyces cochlioides]